MSAVPAMSEAAPGVVAARLRKRIGIYGLTGDAMRLIPSLAANPDVEIVRTFDDDPLAVRARLARSEPGVAALVERTLTCDAEAFATEPSLTAVIDAVGDCALIERFPAGVGDDLQFVSLDAAEMLWGRATGGDVAAQSAETGSACDSHADPTHRIDRRIVRLCADGEGLALATIRIGNLAEIRRRAGDARIAQVLECVRDAVRTRTPSAEVIGPSEEYELLVVLRDPGPEPRDRFVGLARSVARAVFDDGPLNDPVRVSLAFGFACDPAPGGSVEALLAEARKPRVRMV
jgi:GGDEF domain-containing protein